MIGLAILLIYLALGVGVFLLGERLAPPADEEDPATPLGVFLIVMLWPVFLAVVAAEHAAAHRRRK